MSITNLFNEGDDPRPSRRDERRADRAADAALEFEAERLKREEKREDARLRAEEKRKDDAAKLERDLVAKAADDKARAKAEKEAQAEKDRRKAARRQARKDLVARVSTHVPPIAIPVVVVSLIMGWTGQAGAAIALGMGWLSSGVPILFEGSVLTFGTLTATAIDKGQPHKVFYAATWGMGMVAASANAAGHLIQDSSSAGMYRAGAFWVASLMALVVWALVMAGKRAEKSGAQAAEVARWRRLRRSHPVVARRARRIADLTGAEYPVAFELAWERTYGADVAQPLIGEIKSMRRSTYRRAVAEAWDGRRRGDQALADTVPAEDLDGAASDADTVPTQTLEPVPSRRSVFRGRVRVRKARTVPVKALNAVPAGSEMPFPAEESAGADQAVKDAPKLSKQLSRKDLKRAAEVWHERFEMAQKDARYRSLTGHLGVSPYALSSALRRRREDGPLIADALIDAQLVPARLTSE